MKFANWRLLGLVILLVGGIWFRGSTPLLAQTSYGTIVGTVNDPSGAGVPDAKVTVINTETGVTRSVQTNDVGNYRIPSLLPGTYEITTELSGFKRNVLTGVVLTVARTITVDLVLELGAVTESVEVSATAPLLDSSDATLGTVVENREVTELPLNGRYYTDLMKLVPGSVPQGTIFIVGGGRNFSLNGARHEQNSFTLDGVYNNETFFKGFAFSRPTRAMLDRTAAQTTRRRMERRRNMAVLFANRE